MADRLFFFILPEFLAASVWVVDEVIGITTAEDERNRVESLAETLSLERSDQKAIPVPAVDCMTWGFPLVLICVYFFFFFFFFSIINLCNMQRVQQ